MVGSLITNTNWCIAEEHDEHLTLEEGCEEWHIVERRNKFDMDLYYYAFEFFTSQGDWF